MTPLNTPYANSLDRKSDGMRQRVSALIDDEIDAVFADCHTQGEIDASFRREMIIVDRFYAAVTGAINEVQP